jgi:serine/threonine-protein kinase
MATDPGRPAVQAPAPVQEVAVPKKGRDFRLIAAICVAAVMTGITVWGWLQPEPEPEALVPTRTVLTGMDVSFLSGWRMGISPGGRWIVAGAQNGNSHSLYLRSAGETDWRLLQNTEGGTNPSFSPDGQWVLFDVNFSSLFKVPINGGPALPLANGGQGHWAENDSIVFNSGGQIHIVPSSGGESTVLLANDTVNVRWPYLLPGGRGVLFQNGGSATTASVLLLDRQTGQLKVVAPAGNQPRYVKTGHVVFGHGEQALMAIPFDLETLEVTGNQSTVLPSMTVFSGGASQYAFSENGTLVYAVEGELGAGEGRQLAVVDMQGNATLLPLSGGQLDAPRYSPDGTKIAYQDGTEIRVYNTITGASPQLTSGGGLYPVWSPSGDYLYYTESVGGSGFRRPPDGSGAATEVFAAGNSDFIRSVAPGDSLVLLRRNAGLTARDLLVVRVGSSEPEGYLTAQWSEGNGNFSPDGKWVAYQSDESGVSRIYIHSFPDITGQRSISPEAGTDPVWSPDGKTLYYRNGAQFLSVDLTFEPSFSVSAPKFLFEGVTYTRQLGNGWVVNWDIHPDGENFIMVAAAGVEGGSTTGSTIGEVRLVVNWFQELISRTDG